MHTNNLIKITPEIWGMIAMSMYFLVYLGFGSDSYQEIHDVLDYYVGILKAAELSGDLWNLDPNSKIKSILGGLPRYCFHHNLDMLMVLFSALPAFVAYSINLIAVHLIGYFGMNLILRDYVMKGSSVWARVWISFLFAVLPLYPMLGLTLAGVPMLAYVAFNTYFNKGKTWINYSLLLLFTFYSSFVYIGVFACILAFFAFIVLCYLRKKIDYNSLFFLLTMSISYLIFNYFLLFQMFFAHEFVSHRELWIVNGYNIKVVLWAISDILFNGHYHAASFHGFILILVLPIAIFIALKRNQFREKTVFFVLVFFTIVIAVFYGFWQWAPVVEFKKEIKILKIFRWDRFYFLYPSLWYLILAFCITIILESKKKIQKLVNRFVFTLLSVQTLFMLSHDKILMQNFLNITEQIVPLSKDLKLNVLGADYFSMYENKTNTYNGYFQTKAMLELQSLIDLPLSSYRVAGIGVAPSILQYNGFYTIDGYMTSYPLAYKNKILEICEKEQAKSPELMKGFVNWGSKCYLFVADAARREKSIHSIDLNIQKLLELNCRFIITRLRIDENANSSFKLINYVDSDINQQRFYLYSIS